MRYVLGRNAETATAIFEAYANEDRTAAEQLIADDFQFTSPLDNCLDRATYFARCWPNSEAIAEFAFIQVVETGERVVVTYEASTSTGKRFRNTEVLTIRDGRITAVEVYFGWDLPHKAKPGGFLAALDQ